MSEKIQINWNEIIDSLPASVFYNAMTIDQRYECLKKYITQDLWISNYDAVNQSLCDFLKY